MSSIINNLRAAYQEVQEKLKGDQHKLDHDGDGDIDGKDFAMLRAKKKKKDKDEGDIDMNPKLEKGSNTATEQKESRIRTALKGILEKKENHSPNKDKAEKPEDALKGQGAKDMMNQPKEIDDTEEKGHDDASKAGRVTKPAKQRNGGDQVRSGDQKVVNPIQKMKETYLAMQKGESDENI